MNLHKLYSIFFLPLLISLLTMVVVTGCSDDDDELQTNRYGYVQFKLYKSSSLEEGATTRVTDKLDNLSDAQKIKVVMVHEGSTISQTLPLNAYNANNSEFGLRSDKLQLLVGTYKIIGYYLYDKLDEVLLAGPAGEDGEFTVVGGGLQEKALTVDAVERGTVTFKLTKNGIQTRASGEYLFSDIRVIDITVKNLFTRETTPLKGMKVTYKEDYKQTAETGNDKYMDIGTAKCDSAVWLPAGTYQVISYTAYSKSGSVQKELETQSVQGEAFVVEDNKQTEDAIIPIQLSETAEYIKDYKALKAIWEALDGKNWGYHGFGGQEGANWNFNKEIDMWGSQPGVELDNNGRIIGLSLEGFGAKGRVPDAIGQLTELKVLSLGSHGEKISGRIFSKEGISASMSDAQKEKMRMHYKEMFLDYDPRNDLSELLIDGINRDPEQKKIKKNSRIQLKDTQIGQLANNITFVSKAIKRLTKLRQFYIANSPVTAENICEEWEDENSEYAKLYAEEELKWENLTELTDVELYNCPQLRRLPDFLFELPEIQLLNLSCNRGIPGDQLTADWARLASAPVGEKIQILYLGYNNLEKFPEDGSIRNMKKLGLLDCIHNKIKGTLPAFGTDVKLASLTLDYNEIEEIPEEFCGFTEQVETLSFAHNKLKYIPNIFDASSVHVMGGVNFSDNLIGSDNGRNVDPRSGKFKGINASTITLSNNRISKFPTELFEAGSPIGTLSLSGNLLTEIPEYSLRSKEGNYKNTYLLTVIDLRFNKLTKLSDDFRATTLPYLKNMDVSYNCFSRFPTQPLNSSRLQAFGIRHQRDAQGNRILREWPEGITTCPSLIQLQIGSNDIRKVNEKMTPQLWILDIKDNPNISIDLSSVCPYIEAGMYKLIYDKTQDIRGCDALDIKR